MGIGAGLGGLNATVFSVDAGHTRAKSSAIAAIHDLMLRRLRAPDERAVSQAVSLEALLRNEPMRGKV